MKIKVKLFASLRQAVDRSMLKMELPAGATVADLQAHLQAEFPQLNLESSRVHLAVNLRYAKAERTLHDGDEVALFPPVGGG